MFWFRKADKREIFKFGIGSGILEILYILFVAWFIITMGEIMNSGNSILSILAFLLLFVFSASISGFFVLGYPAYLGLQKRFQEAIMTLLITLLTLFAGGVLVFLVAILNK
jgi:hypothetical protein